LFIDCDSIPEIPDIDLSIVHCHCPFLYVRVIPPIIASISTPCAAGMTVSFTCKVIFSGPFGLEDEHNLENKLFILRHSPAFKKNNISTDIS
jgi:hypothetical protein